MLIIAPFAVAGAAFETWNRVIFFWSDFVLHETLGGYEATAAATRTATPPSSSASAPALASIDPQTGAPSATPAPDPTSGEPALYQLQKFSSPLVWTVPRTYSTA